MELCPGIRVIPTFVFLWGFRFWDNAADGTAQEAKIGMYNLFDNIEINKLYEREKSVADNCDEYTPQGNDNYTYNDYLYHLEK